MRSTMNVPTASISGLLTVDQVQDYIHESFLRFYETSFAVRDLVCRA